MWKRVPQADTSRFKDELLVKAEKKLEQLSCYGRCKESISACLKKDPPHSTAQRLARDVLMLMSEQSTDEEIAKWIEVRKKMAYPGEEQIRLIDLDGLTPAGKPDAEVVFVEYSDFQCPFCSRLAPMVEKVVRESNGKARLYFKQFPIKSHPRALEASKASVAADAFGKFWAVTAKLFESRDDLSEEKILEIAKSEGIDPKKFAAEMAKDSVLSRIADEKMEGLKNRVEGTPTLFVNGKEYLLMPTPALLKDRIEEELDILHGKD
ncbi:MAG: thioredoxin domain-containing protein [Deltaproteobacteria bacterium]|nr:thioredoxin domain-containing protein [Deltaproteobacteria bacterium]